VLPTLLGMWILSLSIVIRSFASMVLLDEAGDM